MVPIKTTRIPLRGDACTGKGVRCSGLTPLWAGRFSQKGRTVVQVGLGSETKFLQKAGLKAGGAPVSFVHVL